MSVWDKLRGLELNVEEVTTELKSVDVSTQFTRVTTTVVLAGDGEQGRGEDVTYTAEDHDWFPDLEVRGRTTLGELSAEFDGLRLFETVPTMPAWADYRRWAFESAALDLALRQNDLSLGAAVKRDYHPVRFVVSTRGDPFGWLEHVPGLELKLDPENDWDRPFMERLAATRRVRVLDFKAYYKGTAVDAPIHSVADVRALTIEPGWMNIKPSRFGTTARLLECIEHCAAQGIHMYGGGQFELGVGRRHIQVLASLFYPDGPNDVAPGDYNAGDPRPGLPRSPLDEPEAVGF
jgi:hypothetical protein